MAADWDKAIADDIEANPDKYRWMNEKQTGHFTGREGNDVFAYWDPNTDSYVRQSTADWEQQQKDYVKPEGQRTGNMLTQYVNKYGDHVTGLRPEDKYTGMINGEQVTFAGKDPEAGKFIHTNNGTPVPGVGLLNPDYVEKPKFLEDTNGPRTSYWQNGHTPAERQSLFNQAFANNPDLVNTPEFAQAIANSGVVEEMERNEALYNTPEFGKALEEKWHGTVEGLDVATANINNTQNSDDIPTFIDAAYSLFESDQEAFDAWAAKNPLWAGRFFAYVADATQERQSMIDGHHPLYNDYTYDLPFSLADMMPEVTPRDELTHDYVPEGSGYDYEYYEKRANDLLGYGQDFSGREYKDINNRDGADLFKLGGNNTSRHGSFIDFVSENPLETAAIVALSIYAPELVAQMGLTGVPAGAAAGAITSAGSNIITGNTDDLLPNMITGAVTAGAGSWAAGAEGFLVTKYGWNESVANIVTSSVSDAIINGTDPVDAFVNSALAEGVTLTIEKASDILGDLFSTDEVEVTVNPDGTTSVEVTEAGLEAGQLEEIDVDAITDQYRPLPGSGLEEIDVDAITDNYRPTPPVTQAPGDQMLTGSPEYTYNDQTPMGPPSPPQYTYNDQTPMGPPSNNSSFDGTNASGVEQITVSGENHLVSGPPPTMQDHKAFEFADQNGLGDSVDQLMADNPGLTGSEALRHSMSRNGYIMKKGDFDAAMAAPDPAHYIRTHNPVFSVAAGVDLPRVPGTNSNFVDQSNIGVGEDPTIYANIGDPADDLQRHTTRGDPREPTEITRPNERHGLDLDYEAREAPGPNFEPDRPDLPDFDRPNVEMPGAENFEPPISPIITMPKVDINKSDLLNPDLGGGGGSLSSAIDAGSSAASEAVSEAAAIEVDRVMDSITSSPVIKAEVGKIVDDVVTGADGIDLSPIVDFPQDALDTIAEGVETVLGNIGATVGDASRAGVEAITGAIENANSMSSSTSVGSTVTSPSGGILGGPGAAGTGSVPSNTIGSPSGGPTGTTGTPGSPTGTTGSPTGGGWASDGTTVPAPTTTLPPGYSWVQGPDGLWDAVGDAGTGNGTGGSGSGTGSGAGGIGGIGGTGTGSGSGSGSGSGTGTGSGSGSGDGAGDGSGSGSETPLADGLMGMLGGSKNDYRIPLTEARRIGPLKQHNMSVWQALMNRGQRR